MIATALNFGKSELNYGTVNATKSMAISELFFGK
jgi:hypothetical protein